MAGRMSGKVALITGAARGLGRSHAVRLAEEGADIIALDICKQIDGISHTMGTEADLAETGRLVEALDRRIVTQVADVREPGHLAAAVEAGMAELGHLDVVVANAGIAPIGPQTPTIAYFQVLSVNLSGVINTVEAAFPHLRAGASIVCVGSMAAMLSNTMDNSEAGEGVAGYVVAKRAVARFVRDTAMLLAPHNIRVNAVHPGNTDTNMLHHDEMYRLFRPDLPNPTREDVLPAFGSMHRLPVQTLDPNDISEAVLYLASDAARYVTGMQLRVDAGATIASSTSGAPD